VWQSRLILAGLCEPKELFSAVVAVSVALIREGRMMCRSMCSPFCLAGVFLLVIGGAGISPGQGAEQDQSVPEVRAILAQMRLALDRLRSIQYDARVKRTQHTALRAPGEARAGRDPRDKSQGPEVVDFTMEFALQGQQYFSRVRFKGMRSGKSIDSTAAFNGDKYQRLDESSHVLEVTSRSPKLPYLQMQPIMVPFLFTHRESDPLEYGVLLSASLWDELATRTTISGTDEVNGHPCQVLTLTRSVLNQPATVTVYAASELDYFPIRYVVAGSATCAEVDVTSLEEIESEDGRLVVPTRVVMTDYIGERELMATTEFFIEPATLRVNEEIPPEVFTIAKSRADVYYDADLQKATRLKRSKEPASLVERSRFLRGLLGLSGLVFVVILIIVLSRVRDKRGSKGP